MKIAIVAPSPVPFVYGGAENIYTGLLTELNRTGGHLAEIIKIPTPEGAFWPLIDGYYRFAALDLDHFDAVVSLKYPAWMVPHRNHIVYMQHKLRGLYDTYHLQRQPLLPDLRHDRVRRIWEYTEEAARHGVERTEALIYLRALLNAARNDSSVPAAAFAFPGPLARRVVQFLDGLALGPGQISAYNAISRTVARRPGYFPDGAMVRVIYHPSGLQGFRSGGQDFLFTASRLDRGKRIDLLIDAYRRTDAGLPLIVAGEGPELEALRKRAGGDRRIRFPGHLSADSLLDHYANAAAVLFTPYDEDFGLVALEAMASGTPVVTARDSGGCVELIAPGETGYVVPPDADALAAQIGRVLADLPEAARVGAAARLVAERITWRNLIAELFPGASPPPLPRAFRRSDEGAAAPAVLRGPRRKRLTVLSTYRATSPRGGGPSRVFNLHDRLRRGMDVDILVFETWGSSLRRRQIAPGLTETVVAGNEAYRAAEARLSERIGWVPVSDSAFALIHRLAPEYLDLVRQAVRASDAVVLEHPYLFPALSGALSGAEMAERLILDAHNVESGLKHDIYPDTRPGRAMLGAVLALEQDACAAAAEVWTCAADDRRLLEALFRLPPARLVDVPNGVDTKRIAFVDPLERRMRRRQIGMAGGDRMLACFVGSWHGPNIEAAKRVLACAAWLPDAVFVLVGSVCDALRQEEISVPPNAVLAGVVEERALREILACCDLGLNPMLTGSGTNLKLFEYCAAGAPVVTTPVGARGSGLLPGVHLWQAPPDQFEAAIVAAGAEGPEAASRRAARARRHVERDFDWDVIVGRLLARSAVLTGPARNAPDRPMRKTA